MPGLDELEGDAALDRLGLLGHPDRAHAAFAELLQQLVPAGEDRRRRRSAAAAEGRTRRWPGRRRVGRPGGRGRPAAPRRGGAARGRGSARPGTRPARRSGTARAAWNSTSSVMGMALRDESGSDPPLTCGIRIENASNRAKMSKTGAVSPNRPVPGTARPGRTPSRGRPSPARCPAPRPPRPASGRRSTRSSTSFAFRASLAASRVRASSRASRSSDRSGAARRSGSRSARPRPPPRFCGLPLRGRGRPGCGAWPRPRRRRSGRGRRRAALAARRPGAGTPRGPGRSAAASARRASRASCAAASCAARRTQRQQVAGGPAVAAAAASRRRVTSSLMGVPRAYPPARPSASRVRQQVTNVGKWMRRPAHCATFCRFVAPAPFRLSSSVSFARFIRPHPPP